MQSERVVSGRANLRDGMARYYIPEIGAESKTQKFRRVCFQCPLVKICDQGKKGTVMITLPDTEATRDTSGEIENQAACLQ